MYQKQYLHAITVWNTFKMNTMKGYHDHYLKKNVLLLAVRILWINS